MTPFPEAEIMTIKRLEVALRKMDFKLLKDGAYKLHEKYHAGHKFEYLDLLKDLLLELLNNSSIPSDVKDILCPTIEDILAQDNYNKPNEQASNLTSSSYTTPQFEQISKEELEIIADEPIYGESNQESSKFEFQPEVKINAFDAFGSKPTQSQMPHIQSQNQMQSQSLIQSQSQVQPQRFFAQSPFSAEPFKEFNHPAPQINTFEQIQEPKIEANNELVEQQTEQDFEAEQKFESVIEQKIEQAQEKVDVSQTPQTIEEKQEIKERKSIAIFYSQDNSKEKIKNILKYREIISQTNEKNASIDDLMALISEITTQANTNTIELQGVLKQLSVKGNKTNLITNSQSEMLIELLETNDITYSLYKNDENNKISLIPLFGLSNLFYCAECGEVYLDKSSEIKPLVLECPQCKNPMYVDFWGATKDSKLNLDYYNEALINLANSRVWLIVHPSFNDKISSDLIESALKVSNIVEEIYVLDKDINTRENYKTFISKIKPSVKVNVNNNSLEEFFGAI